LALPKKYSKLRKKVFASYKDNGGLFLKKGGNKMQNRKSFLSRTFDDAAGQEFIYYSM
jgi:hypothetical protein